MDDQVNIFEKSTQLPLRNQSKVLVLGGTISNNDGQIYIDRYKYGFDPKSKAKNTKYEKVCKGLRDLEVLNELQDY